MDRREALNRYIKENIVKLTSESASKNVEKKIRKDFSEKHNLKSDARFSGKDVAEEIAKYIVRTQSLSKSEFISQIQKIPFIGLEIGETQLDVVYDTYSKDNSLIISSEDLPKLSSEEYVRKIQEEFAEKAKNRVEKDNELVLLEIEKLRDELLKEREEIKKFTSELNELPENLSIEEIEKKIEKPNQESIIDGSVSWWRKLGLVQNPFDTNTGLYGITKEKYEDVIVKTPLVRKYREELDNTPSSIVGRTIIISGDFGSGKTTFFQYLSNYAIARGISPINIILNPSPNVSSLTNFFLEQLHESLSDIFFEINKYDPRMQINSENYYKSCLELFRNLRNNAPRGFIVFIDGLHKSEIYLPQTLEFLQQIQNVSEYFSQKDIKIGFFIAGSLLWESELKHKPSLSGSYYRQESIPPLTEDLAVDAINRRINLYSGSEPSLMIIERKGLINAFSILKNRLNKGITFRDFLDHIRERLELNQFEEVGLSVKIHIETAEAVNATLLRTPLGETYKSILRDISYSPTLRTVFQKTVVKIFNNKGVAESDYLFKNNKGVFYLLRKYDLIVQRRRPDESFFRWYLSDEFLRTILTTSENLKLTPTRILAAAFAEQSMMKNSESNLIYGSSLERLNNLISTWQDSSPDVAQLLEKSKESINQITKDLSEFRQINPWNLQNSIMNIIKSLNIIVNSKQKEADQLGIFANSWIAPENIDEIKKFLLDIDKVKENGPNIYAIHYNNNKLTSQLLDLLSDLVKGESISRLKGRNLLVKEFETVNNLRNKFFSQGYSEVVDGVSTNLEKNIRNVVYPCMRAIWGDDALKVLPSDIFTRIKDLPTRGHPRTKRPNDVNFFYDISRSEYSKVLFSKPIEKAMFCDILNESDLKKLRENLELTFSLADRTAHKDRESYFRERATEILDILKTFPWILEIFHSLTFKFFVKCDIELYNKEGGLSAKFLPLHYNTLNQKTWNIQKEDIKEYMKDLLNSVATNDLTIENPVQFLGASKFDPEIALSIFRAALKQGYLKCTGQEIQPIRVSITNDGKELLTRYN